MLSYSCMNKVIEFDLELFDYNKELKKYLGMAKYLIGTGDFVNASKAFHSGVVTWLKVFVDDVAIKESEDDELVLYGLQDNENISNDEYENIQDILEIPSNNDDLVRKFNDFIALAKRKITSQRFEEQKVKRAEKIVNTYKEKDTIVPKTTRRTGEPGKPVMPGGSQRVLRPVNQEKKATMQPTYSQPANDSCLYRSGRAQVLVDRSNPKNRAIKDYYHSDDNKINSQIDKSFKSLIFNYKKTQIGTTIGGTLLIMLRLVIYYLFSSKIMAVYFFPERAINPTIKIIIYAAICLINIFEFILMRDDKAIALANAQLLSNGTITDSQTRTRVPEAKLLLIGACFGSFGLKKGMNSFYHKISKLKFKLVYVFVIIHIYVLLFWII